MPCPLTGKSEMKYVLLAFGILLAIAGAYSIYTGYGIIEDERGWATVIAGATGLTGGVIVAALAFVLGSLDRLRAALETQAVYATEAAHLALASAALPAPENAPAPQREEPVFDTVDRAAPVARSEPPPAPAAAPPAPKAPEPAAKAQSRASTAFTAAAARAREERRSEPSINDLWRRVGVDLDTNKPGKVAENPARNRPESSPAATSDWLDEALAGFEEAIAPKSPEPREEAPPLAPRVPPEQPQPEVIGRYEAEGTLYVMYADGSIDAQTEEGVLRFRSMAELQAFFQG
jgi:hypothetical protein